ncbi:MAG: aminotransferase class III-fold pyridoxal phosphate-dependent enzyme [Ruminococcaceae bacterium]|nr:aminotransferase class III-fold pyridoxal phosphate-dependent enzyme [Oscillospiraceae bacterium]
MSKAQELYTHAKERIPGGTQLLSKRPEQFAPDQWPSYFTKAKGCEVWDVDGNHYYDMTTNGIGACLLGFADPDVTAAVTERIQNGCMSTLNPPEEVALADKLCEIHPWASRVRFARTGGEICAVAVRIARATTKRDLVAICGYHGWCDWYIAANLGDSASLDGQLLPGLKPAGVPGALRNSALTFQYGNREELDAIIKTYGDRLACVIMEPVRNSIPDDDFLTYVRDSIHKVGGLLIYDEITIGWRLTFGGSHRVLGITPDIAVFAKALGNGHPIAAVIGTKEAMYGTEDSFISSTYWTESVGPVAALAAIKKMEETRVWEHVEKMGTMLIDAWNRLAEKHGIPAEGGGLPCLAHLTFTKYPLELKTLYTVLMLKRGFLGNVAFYPTLAHTPEMMAKYEEAIDAVFAEMRSVLDKEDYDALVEAIGGPVCQSGFKRLIN